MMTMEDRVIAFIEDMPGSTPLEILDEFGRQDPEVLEAIETLIRKGRLERAG